MIEWAPGTKNAHGVYCPHEVLALPRAVKGWRGCDRVSIELVQTPEGWRSYRHYSFFTGSWEGSAGPITDQCTPHPTREAAICEQVERLRIELSKPTDPAMQREAREMIAWLDELVPAQGDLFA